MSGNRKIIAEFKKLWSDCMKRKKYIALLVESEWIMKRIYKDKPIMMNSYIDNYDLQ